MKGLILLREMEDCLYCVRPYIRKKLISIGYIGYISYSSRKVIRVFVDILSRNDKNDSVKDQSWLRLAFLEKLCIH